MISLPETKYAKSGDISIAYQVMGDGPLDLVMVPGIFSHVEFAHELPGYTRSMEQLAAFARVITFDKRGNGLSDRIAGAPSLEERMDDLRAVMDAVGSERAAIFGNSEGGPMSALFAATHPTHTLGLILYGSFARVVEASDCPAGVSPKAVEIMTANLDETWGQGLGLDVYAQSFASDPQWRALAGKFERLSCSPGAFRALAELDMQIDVRSVLSSIRVPTLVLHRGDDAMIPLEAGRYLAEHIPTARFIQLDGEHLWFTGDVGRLVGEIEEFLTGERHAVGPERALASVLFTDIVESTERAEEFGDRRWTELLDAHDNLATREVERFRGSMIKTTGDGILATFDGPARAINCASAMRDGVRALGLEIRAGLHIGEIELRGDDIGGIAVHIAARVLGKAEPGEVLVSRTLTDLVAGSDLRFEDRGEHELKGVAEQWHLFAAQA